MLIAANLDNENKVLILGLYQENIDRLVNDQPIEKDLGKEGVPGLEAWKVYILGPEDTERFIAAFGADELP